MKRIERACTVIQFDERSTKGHYLYTVGLNIFYLYTLYIEQHIKTYNNIQYTNGIQKKLFRLIRICLYTVRLCAST